MYEEHIRQRMADLVAAWNRGDLRSFVDSFLHDAEYIAGDGEWIRGSWAIEERFRREFRTPALLSVEETSVRILSADAALAHLVWSSATRHGVLTAVFAAPDWRIVSLQSTDVARQP